MAEVGPVFNFMSSRCRSYTGVGRPGHEPTIRPLRREASDLGIRGYAKYDEEGLERAIREARLVVRLVE